MKNKVKTHKGMAKRAKLTATGKVRRDRRRYRNSRVPRISNKSSNTDEKKLELSSVASKRVKKLLNI